MCEAHSDHEGSIPATTAVANPPTPTLDISGLQPYAEFLCTQEGIRRTAVGFIGYSAVGPGDRVLIAVDSQYDNRIPEAIARALRDRLGARPDIVIVDVGPDRPFDEVDEIRAIMRREPWRNAPRRYEGVPWVEELAVRERYAMLIHGRGGGHAADPRVERYEFIPWQIEEHLACAATTYPRELHALINRKAWEPIWRGAGGRVHLTDAEGTDLAYTLWPDYYGRRGTPFKESPNMGHLMAHPLPPIVPRADAEGVVTGTTSHFSRAFPRIGLRLEGGRLEAIEGGGGYGEAWRELLEESRSTRYPCFPREGLFWLWEVAIGTNPKIRRPSTIHLHSSGGFEWERRRSGIIHVGLGTSWRSEYEDWAGERGLLYGHLHVHLLFPTLDVVMPSGESVRVIDRGRLVALDDAEVRELAERLGDPDDLLTEDWIPEVPGINVPGSYEEFARDPSRWIYRSEGSPA
ncbi:MAG TPA: hypothetical protein VFD01_08275 [Candidatus Dormibacteraeota bacterium]|nr:hypothetical protein [Candidatus Dormibacteraeota bacterium]